MAGGYKNIQPSDGKQFSSDNQPRNRRKSTQFLTDLLTKQLNKKKEVVVDAYDPETGQRIKAKIINPTKDIIIMALLRKAAQGDVRALNLVFERIEGKAKVFMELTGGGGEPLMPKKSIENISTEDLERLLTEADGQQR